MNYIQKYKPTSQKELFHKDIVSHTRKWIVQLEQLLNDETNSLKKILILYGPSGCGKTITIDILFKSFNLICYDANEFKYNRKIEEVLTNLIGGKTQTLQNIEKWNHKNKKDKYNIIFIDNMEGCDIQIDEIINFIHIKQNTNIPIIFGCNVHQIKTLASDTIINNTNTTIYKLNLPSLLELSKLGSEINDKEKLNLSKSDIKKIIDICDCDIRQFLYILNNWSLIKTNFDGFLSTIELKNRDIDMSNKLNHVFNPKFKYSFHHFDLICSSEPITISNHIYQNYIDQIEKNNKLASQKQLLSNIENISNTFSSSDCFQKKIFDDQNWELYDQYTVISCVQPIYTIKNIDLNEHQCNDNVFLPYKENVFLPYKDISFNYYNSLQEVKKVCFENIANPYLSNIISKWKPKYTTELITKIDLSTAFYITQALVVNIQIIDDFFTKHKKGKNISKKEKLELSRQIENEDEKTVAALDYIITFIINYRLFTFDIEQVLMSKNKCDDYINEYIEILEIRLFKRFLNIFTLNVNLILKAHIETVIKYTILNILFKYINSYENNKNIIMDRNIEEMTISLDKIWNF